MHVRLKCAVRNGQSERRSGLGGHFAAKRRHLRESLDGTRHTTLEQRGTLYSLFTNDSPPRIHDYCIFATQTTTHRAQPTLPPGLGASQFTRNVPCQPGQRLLSPPKRISRKTRPDINTIHPPTSAAVAPASPPRLLATSKARRPLSARLSLSSLDIR